MASYKMVCWTFSAVVALLMLLVLFLPESPIWLQQAGRYEESLASAKKLWGPEFEFQNDKKEKVFNSFSQNFNDNFTSSFRQEIEISIYVSIHIFKD